jgi:hypothetical protein
VKPAAVKPTAVKPTATEPAAVGFGSSSADQRGESDRDDGNRLG